MIQQIEKELYKLLEYKSGDFADGNDWVHFVKVRGAGCRLQVQITGMEGQFWTI